MKKIILVLLSFVMVSAFSACSGNVEDTSSPAESVTSEAFNPEAVEYKTIRAFGIIVDIPSDYVVTEGEIYLITTPEYPAKGDNITITSAAGSLDDFTEKNMTSALQTQFDFEKFNHYKKVNSSIKEQVVIFYDFDTVFNGVSMNIKQLNLQSGDNVVTLTFCLLNEELKEQFDRIFLTASVIGS